MVKKYNNIEIKQDYAVIKIVNNIYGDYDCLIDIEDIGKIKNYYWNIRYDKRHPNCVPYVESHKNGKRIHLHRLIMDCPFNMVVDHINGNNIDNRKNNLRIVTRNTNRLNNHKAKNIYYNKRDDLFFVVFIVEGKRKSLCYTRDIKEAEYYANLGKKLILENKIDELFSIPCKCIMHSYD